MWRPSCALQHGQQIHSAVETLLASLGMDVRLCVGSHLCYGSAGTYPMLQSELVYRLRDDKLAELQAIQPKCIVSTNIGCPARLQSGTDIPAECWIELVDHMLV